MKTTIQLKIERALLVVLLFILITYSFQAEAQSRRNYYKNFSGAWYSKNFGVELSAATSQFQLQSNITELSHLRTSYFGFNLGGVIANNGSKVKVTVGMFSSDNSVPYNIDLYQAGASWNVYILRKERLKSHLLEPYFLLGANLVHAKFYGNYLSPDVATNYSASNPPYLGHTGWVYANVGVGVEYHLENGDLKFIHAFAQASYGVPAISVYSDKAFSQTVAMGSVSFAVGLNFAISR